jgi:hypothetical protein
LAEIQTQLKVTPGYSECVLENKETKETATASVKECAYEYSEPKGVGESETEFTDSMEISGSSCK